MFREFGLLERLQCICVVLIVTFNRYTVSVLPHIMSINSSHKTIAWEDGKSKKTE